MEKKAAETQKARSDAESVTDRIYSMEGWIKKQSSGDPASTTEMLKTVYDDEWDEEDQGLREL